MSIDEQPMNVYWSGQKSPTSNKYKINYKGTVATANALPATGNKKGDTYNISEDGSDYIWTGTEWDRFGANVYIGATSIANGIQGLVPPASNSQIYSLLTGGGTWESAEDLGLALDDKVVHLTGDESISGVKTLGDMLICNGIFVKSNAATGTVTILGGVDATAYGGAKLDICGASHSSYPGGFRLQAGKPSTYKQLILLPDGTATWNGQAIQTSSDERLKTPLSAVPDSVLDAWGDVGWGQFQYLEAVASKGESARQHLGLIAQAVKTVFESRGLDACEYGILCHEEHPMTEEEPATDLWMVRYAEALAMEAAYQRRRADKTEARIKALEDRLSALEEKFV